MEAFDFSADEMFVIVAALLQVRDQKQDFWGAMLDGSEALMLCSDFHSNREAVLFHTKRFAQTVNRKLDRYYLLTQNGDAELAEATMAFNAAECNYFEELELKWPLGSGTPPEWQGNQGSKLRTLYAKYAAAKATYEALIAD